MNDYKELIEVLKNAEHIALCGNGAFNTVLVERCYEAADAIEQLVRERDAAIADAAVMERCKVCKHYKDDYLCRMKCRFGSMWEWRGVQE